MKRYTLPQFQQQSLLTRIIAALVTIAVTAVAIFVGAIFLAVFVGLAVIAALVIWARVWWIRRKLEKEGHIPSGQSTAWSRQAGSRPDKPSGGRVIEGDAEVKSDPRNNND